MWIPATIHQRRLCNLCSSSTCILKSLKLVQCTQIKAWQNDYNYFHCRRRRRRRRCCCCRCCRHRIHSVDAMETMPAIEKRNPRAVIVVCNSHIRARNTRCCVRFVSSIITTTIIIETISTAKELWVAFVDKSSTCVNSSHCAVESHNRNDLQSHWRNKIPAHE